MRYKALLFSLLLSGCTPFAPLEVQTQIITPAYLASYKVGTPDPRLDEPFLSQRLLVQWFLPKSCETSLTLLLRVRLKSLEEKIFVYPLPQRHGTYYIDISKEEGEILSYCAQVLGESEGLIAEWRHPMWVESLKL